MTLWGAHASPLRPRVPRSASPPNTWVAFILAETPSLPPTTVLAKDLFGEDAEESHPGFAAANAPQNFATRSQLGGFSPPLPCLNTHHDDATTRRAVSAAIPLENPPTALAVRTASDRAGRSC